MGWIHQHGEPTLKPRKGSDGSDAAGGILVEQAGGDGTPDVGDDGNIIGIDSQVVNSADCMEVTLAVGWLPWLCFG